MTKRPGFYNIMPIYNIPTVIEKGILSNRKADKIRHKSIALQEVQDRRDEKKVPGGLCLHDYANIYFDPRNPMMYKKRNLAEKLCVLTINAEIMDLANVVVSDRNASSSYARFYSPIEGIRKLDFQIIFMTSWTSDNPFTEMSQKSIKCAEVLVPNHIPYEYISSALVVNETAMKELMKLGFEKKIEINSKVFFGR